MKSGVFSSLLIGGALTEVLASWLAPKSIVWYFQPPVQTEFSCTEPIAWALHRMQVIQIGALVVGGVMGVVVYYALRRRAARDPRRIG